MDAIAIVLAGTRGAIVLALLFVVPGITLGPVLVPGASTNLTRIGRAVGVTIVVTAIASTALARLGLLRPTILLALLVGLTLLPLHSRLPRRPRRPTRRAGRWWIGAAMGAVLAAVLAILPARLQSGSSVLPPGPTAWFDAVSAWAAATSGGFATSLPAWGAAGTLGVDHGPLTAHSAAVFALVPGDPLLQLELYRVVVLLAGLVLATLLFRRWSSTWIALLGAILLFRTVRVDTLVSGYGPAGLALVVGLFAAWLADRAIVERSVRLVVAATVAASLVLMTQVEVFLVFAAVIVGISLGRALVRPGGGPESAGGLGHRHGRRVGLRAPVGRDVGRPLALGVAIVAAAVLGGLIGDIVLTGDVRIVRYAVTGSGDVPAPASVDELPPGWQSSGDPTWDFHVAATDASQFGQPPPTAFIDGRLLPGSIVHVWPAVDGRVLLSLVLLATLLAVPLVGWPFTDARRQRAILGWTAYTLLLLGGAVVLFSFGQVYVARRIGPTGLIPFIALVPVAAAIVGLAWLDRLIRPRLRSTLRRGAMPLAGAILAVVTAAVALPELPSGAEDDRPPVLTAIGYDAYQSIAAKVGSDVHILANSWTDGTVAAVSERIGIVDGPPPYLAEPAMLGRATALLLGARRLFAEPDGPGATRYLLREHVDYLLVVTPSGTGDDLGGHAPFDVDVAALRASSRYSLEQTFGDGRLLLFRVNH